ncbi:phosphate regulon sensor histidine kinase PhoR [Bacterioplanoides sp.]|uniref:phosphate regulon sensor histidine kinase PhoR n=1 Tax=Bacterioplanoides sp. TaxID=2066072 RepID=UPI003B00159A
MTSGWRRELRPLLLLLTIALAAGYHFDTLSISLALACGLYIIWQWLQLYRLHHWLKQGQSTQLPSTYGIWGSIFYQTQRLQQRSQKHQQRLQAIINRIQDSTAALQDAVLMVDSHGNLEWWNRAAGEFLGLKAPVDVGQPITNLIRNPLFKTYFDSVSYDEPLSIPSPVNAQLQLQFNITLFGRKDRLILVHDVTRLKQLEAMRKDFVANVSHELRTPLTVVSGYIETMDMAADYLPPRWGRMISQMAQQSRRMENLITDLLMLSRLETSHQNQSDTIAITPMLATIVADAQALSGERDHNITLAIQSDTQLRGYQDELHSAFSNLIFNAVKYTQDGGDIEVSWSDHGEGVRLCVKDNGPGIDEHHIPRLTERFYRADPSRNNQTGGTGLGLAIVKHVLLRHQAELEIRSTLGQGSEFCCHFPAERCLTD